MELITLKVKIEVKKGDNEAFKAGEDWYNLDRELKGELKPKLEKIAKGTEVVITFEKKGTARYVKSIETEVKKEKNTTNTTTSEDKPKCSNCGVELKDAKYELCYTCNKEHPELAKKSKSNWRKGSGSSTYQDNPAKTAQIQRGNAGNMAADVASSLKFEKPKDAIEYTLILANAFLDWLRLE